MALQLADRVQQTGTANTTVSFNLSGSVSGYQSFSSAITTGNTTYYTASDGINWEVGIGTLTSSILLTRTTILSSSNSNAAVSTFGSPVNVFVTYPSERSVNLDQSTGTAFAPQFSASNGLLVNATTVNTSYTIPTGSNAVSVGPMTVATGQSVTVSTGSRWVVL